MKWIEPSIESIITSGIIYYSHDQRNICERICKVLKIDLFPDSDQEHFWCISNNGWTKQNIKEEDQKINSKTLVFDDVVIDKMKNANSNILFCFNENIIEGMIHFTNYDNQLIYQALYQNFYIYETNLREHLSSLNFNYKDFEQYYAYKLNKSKNEKDREFYCKQLDRIRSQKFIEEAKQLRPLQRLDLLELMLFAKSSYHKAEMPQIIGLKKISSDNISKLRNTVMHSKDFIGSSDNQPYDFETFQNFFKQVINFKKDFMLLRDLRNNLIKEQKIRFNEYTLEQISKMNNTEIEDFFYNRF